MDCSNARLLLQLRTACGDELADPEREELDFHLAGCPMCRAMDQDQRRFDDQVGRALRDVPVPEGLRERLLAAVAPGQPPARRPRRWLKRAGLGLGLATAASLGLVVWAWFFWQGPLEPTISPNRALMGYLATLPRDSASVNEELWALGARRCAPDWVDYRYLSAPPALAILPGYASEKNPRKYKFPLLVFTRRKGLEEVKMFIVPKRGYQMEATEPAAYDNYNVALHEGPYYTYLMLYKGDGWEWLKRPDADR